MLSFFFSLSTQTEYFNDIQILVGSNTVNRRDVTVTGDANLQQFLIDNGASFDSAVKVVKRAKFTKKCGIVLHTARSTFTEQAAFVSLHAGKTLQQFRQIFDNDVCRFAFREALIISVTSNGDTKMITLTRVEASARFSFGRYADAFSELLYRFPAFYYLTDLLRNNVQTYFQQVEKIFYPTLKNFY